MKKILFILIGLIMSNIAFSQTTSAVYVVFTSVATGDGVRKAVMDGNDYIPQKNNYPRILFFMEDKKINAFKTFYHESLKSKPDNLTMQLKPKSFLQQIDYIDWDIIAPKLANREEAEEKYKQILAHDKIYFIDRNDFSSSTIKVIEVKAMKARY